jgi:hypothetical protein
MFINRLGQANKIIDPSQSAFPDTIVIIEHGGRKYQRSRD